MAHMIAYTWTKWSFQILRVFFSGVLDSCLDSLIFVFYSRMTDFFGKHFHHKDNQLIQIEFHLKKMTIFDSRSLLFRKICGNFSVRETVQIPQRSQASHSLNRLSGKVMLRVYQMMCLVRAAAVKGTKSRQCSIQQPYERKSGRWFSLTQHKHF